MKIIIVGAGEVGFHLAKKLSEENQDVHLIDKDPDKVRRITENLDAQVILGSGTSPEILRNSGVIDADMLIAATDSDEVNLVACLLARTFSNYILKIARIRNPEYLEEKDLFRENLLGVDHIINPESVMVETIRNLMMVPAASDVIDFVEGQVKLIGITVQANSPFVGRRLFSFREVGEKVLVGAIVRGDRVIIPRGEDTIQAHDLLYLVVRSDQLPDVFQFFGLEHRELKRVLIIGAGATGTALAKALDQTGINVKIIDKDPQKCASLSESLGKATIIHGDGTDQDLLKEENVEGVDFLVAITGNEESNVLISLLGKGLGAKKTITRIDKLSYIPLVTAIGIDTIISARLSAIRAILQYIRRGKIIAVAPLKGEHAEALEAEALETSEIINTPLAEVKFPKGALVGAVVRNGEIIIPRGDTVITPGDRLIIFALRKVLPKLEKLLTVKLEYF